ncbi:unnamed protein product [Paramecium sonneborni]|uniref:Uncharacterized protein n=1 Tax=Paramecium sonneborni TaxID=65129 RepID=A0A8S1RNY6_9CILI|nr:unnamed protein product [Paramecium sonneborni]CAD8128416.1 unnamed protein product [Paramecium sonneborni]
MLLLNLFVILNEKQTKISQIQEKKLNDMGLILMLDFIPNHSAIDSPFRTSNIDYYIRAPLILLSLMILNTTYLMELVMVVINGMDFGKTLISGIIGIKIQELFSNLLSTKQPQFHMV